MENFCDGQNKGTDFKNDAGREGKSLCSGADNWHTKEIKRLNIPSVMMVDGPHGLRKQEGKRIIWD